MTKRIIAVCPSHGTARLTVLTSTGEIFEQKRRGGNARQPYTWEILPAPDGAGKIVSLALAADNMLIAVNSRGTVYRQCGSGMLDAPLTWEVVDLTGLNQ